MHRMNIDSVSHPGRRIALGMSKLQVARSVLAAGADGIAWDDHPFSHGGLIPNLPATTIASTPTQIEQKELILPAIQRERKSTRPNSSHVSISYAGVSSQKNTDI